MAHVIDYIEFAVDDLEQSKAFYAKALGWAFNDYGPDYAGIKDPRTGGEFGGLNPQPVASRGEGVLALIRTDDAEAALASVVEAGWQVGLAMHDYPGGRRRRLRRLKPLYESLWILCLVSHGSHGSAP